MFQRIMAKNMGTMKVIAAQAPNHLRAGLPLLKIAVPVGAFVLWAAWPAAGDTIMGRNVAEE